MVSTSNVIGFAGIHRPDLVAVAGDPGKGAVADGHDAILPALALADEEGAEREPLWNAWIAERQGG